MLTNLHTIKTFSPLHFTSTAANLQHFVGPAVATQCDA